MWFGGHARDWADRLDDHAGLGDECALFAKELDAAREDDDRLRRGRATATRMLTSGQFDGAEYRAAVAEADRERADVAARIAAVKACAEARCPGRGRL